MSDADQGEQPDLGEVDDEWSEFGEDAMEINLDEDGRIADTPNALNFSFRAIDKFLAFEEDSWLHIVVEDCKKVFTGEVTFWLPAEMKPRTTLERLARQIFDFHTSSCAGKYNTKKSGAEWWVQVREEGGKHENIGFHWDKDEELVDQAGINVTPQISTGNEWHQCRAVLGSIDCDRAFLFSMYRVQ